MDEVYNSNIRSASLIFNKEYNEKLEITTNFHAFLSEKICHTIIIYEI